MKNEVCRVMLVVVHDYMWFPYWHFYFCIVYFWVMDCNQESGEDVHLNLC